MTSTSTIRVETVFDVMREQFQNGRYVGKLEGRLDELAFDSALSSEDKRREYQLEMDWIKEQLEYFPESQNLVGLIAYEFGRLVG